MNFDNNLPIYIQIYDSFCEDVLAGKLLPNDRISSVRDYASEIGVNPNTIMRTYERLTGDGIIYNKRGIGYFVSSCAKDIILKYEKEKFLNEEVPNILKKMELLNLNPKEVFK